MRHRIRFILFTILLINTAVYAGDIATNSMIKKTTSSQKKLTMLDTDFFGEDDINSSPIFKVNVSNDEYRYDKMALSFDSAYINKYTYRILDILDEYNYKATFFMTKDFMVKNKKQVKEILKRGHEIGNHSTTHPDLRNLSDEQVKSQIQQCDKTAYDLFGVNMSLFRFPYGAYDKRTLDIIQELGYYPIQWNFDSLDWKNNGAEPLLNRILHNREKMIPGAIFLFHNGADYTPQVLAQVIETIEQKGLRLCKVSDLIYDKNFAIDKKGAQYKKQIATISNAG